MIGGSFVWGKDYTSGDSGKANFAFCAKSKAFGKGEFIYKDVSDLT